MINALDTVTKLGKSVENADRVMDLIKSYFSEGVVIKLGVCTPIATYLIVSYLKSHAGKGIDERLLKKLDELAYELKITNMAEILLLRQSSAEFLLNKKEKSTDGLSNEVKKHIDKVEKETLDTLKATDPFSDDFINHLKYYQVMLSKDLDQKIYNLSDMEKINYVGIKSNSSALMDLIYAGKLKHLSVKADSINYHTISRAVGSNTVTNYGLALKKTIKNNLHQLYWAILRNSSSPVEIINLVMKEAYANRNKDKEEIGYDLGIDELNKLGADFEKAFKETYNNFMKTHWSDNHVLNKIYAEVLFRHAFLSTNLDISYKLANYSFSYAARQAYLGAEDIVEPVLHPVKTVKNVFTLSKNMLLHPINTSNHIVKSTCASVWNQPTRALTRMAGDVLFSKGSNALGSKLLTSNKVKFLKKMPIPKRRPKL